MKVRRMSGLTAALMALVTAGAVVGTTSPATADGYHDHDDKQRAKPCNVYPPGKKFHITAAPTESTVRTGANIDVVATVTRGERRDRKHCVYFVTKFYYTYSDSVQQSHRTGTNGRAAYVAGPITRNPTKFYFELLYNDVDITSNIGVIHTRPRR